MEIGNSRILSKQILVAKHYMEIPLKKKKFKMRK